MEIKKFVLDNLESNSYLYYNLKSKETFLIDIGGKNIKDILEYIKANKLNLTKLILTHGHIDHIEGLKRLIQYKNDLQIYIGQEDLEFLYDSNLNLSTYVNGYDFKISKDINIKTYDSKNPIGILNPIDSPGHTNGSKMLYDKKEGVLFSGDVIFKNGIGRTDFPTGSIKKMETTMKKLLSFPKSTVVYPGHGPKFRLEEKLD
ncbi:MAG: MBL fold metallo-hydrolase [Fusobacteriota bacterium]